MPPLTQTPHRQPKLLPVNAAPISEFVHIPEGTIASGCSMYPRPTMAEVAVERQYPALQPLKRTPVNERKGVLRVYRFGHTRRDTHHRPHHLFPSPQLARRHHGIEI